jgi:hypothetical protein
MNARGFSILAGASDVRVLGRPEPRLKAVSISVTCHCHSMNIQPDVLYPSAPEGHTFAGPIRGPRKLSLKCLIIHSL